MPYFPIILLAIIQGITEFLPISSSGHLEIVQSIIEWLGLNSTHYSQQQKLALEIAVHFGSLVAVMLYLWKDLLRIIINIPTTIMGRRKSDNRLFIHLVIASIPTSIVGLLGYKYIAQNLHTLEFIGWASIIFAILLWISDHFSHSHRISSMKMSDSLLIGIAQTFALIPGASRAGTTMTMARFLKYTRVDAARFSLLLSIPILFGAGALAFYDLYQTPDKIFQNTLFVGVLCSFISSYIAIILMMSWLKHASFRPFVIYRLILGTVLLLWFYL